MYTELYTKNPRSNFIIILYNLCLQILDSEQSDESIDSTMMCGFFVFVSV